MRPSHTLDSDPIRYTPSMAEAGGPDEEQVTQDLIDTMLSISRTTHADGHGALRSVHAKSHGVMEGTLEVLGDLPPELAQGLFAQPARYRAAVRLSTTPGDLLSDRVSTPRGLSLRVFDVPGERLPSRLDEAVQDFIMINGPAFNARTSKDFLKNVKMLAKTTDRAERAKELGSAFLRGTEKVIEAVGGESGTLKSLGGEPRHHPLGETYYTQVPLRYGDYVAKLSLAPVSPELKALTDQNVDLEADNALRDAVAEHIRSHGGTWELRAQLSTNLDDMPIEDPTVAWDEEASPYRTVARLDIPAQDSWAADKQESIDRAMAFNPWHGIEAHLPLGEIMRVRKRVYEASEAFRAEHR